MGGAVLGATLALKDKVSPVRTPVTAEKMGERRLAGELRLMGLLWALVRGGFQSNPFSIFVARYTTPLGGLVGERGEAIGSITHGGFFFLSGKVSNLLQIFLVGSGF